MRFVMVSVDEYDRLRRRERITGRAEDLDNKTLEAIRGIERCRGSKAAAKDLA